MHIRNRLSTAVILASALALAAPGTASAAPPFSAPVDIVRMDFEPGSDVPVSVTPTIIGGEAAPKAYWGVLSGAGHGGSSGMWCAGALYPSGAPSVYGLYPATTRGTAEKHLPELADYYSATLKFRYRMPSLGGADANAFRVGWSLAGPGGEAVDPSTTHGSFALAQSWVSSLAFDLTSPSGTANLSRRPGVVSFAFFDRVETYQRPLSGNGVTVDDVVVAGFKFGPVRELGTSYVSGQGVRIAWQRPAASTQGSQDDTRAIAYRVWRSPAGADSWTELTKSGRVTGTGFLDGGAAVSDRYDYAVQVWDAGNGGGRGPQSLIGYPEAPRLTASAPSVSDYARVTVSGSIMDPRGRPFPAGTKISIQASRDNKSFASVGTALTSDTGTFSFVARPTTTRYYRARFAGSDVFRAARSRSFKVVPRVSLGAPVTPSRPRSSELFTVYGSLKPRHKEGTYPVQVHFDRQVAGGVWQSYRVVNARAYDYSTFSRYRAPVKLPAGVWRIRAHHPPDSKNAATWSEYRYFEVKP